MSRSALRGRGSSGPLRVLACLGVLVIATACASAGGSGDYMSETYDFRGIRSAYLETPVEVRLRTGSGGDTRSLENTVAEALREHVRRELGWSSVASRQDADVVIGFRLTDWENGSEGSRVGGAVTLRVPATEEVVFSASSVYPNRYGAGGVGGPLENMPNLFDRLFDAIQSQP